MLKSKKSALILAFIIFISILILFSNLGVNFKNDIFSYNNTLNYSNTLNNYWLKSKNNQSYINGTSDYIVNFLSYYKIRPYFGKEYIEEFSIMMPNFKHQSSIEVLSKHGKLVKKYQYNQDFLEDFKGNIKSGTVKNKFIYADGINFIANNPNEIVLLDIYKNKSNDEILKIDSKLKSLGVAAVISPATTADLKQNSNIYNPKLYSDHRGLVKFVVSNSVFKQLRRYSEKGYLIKVNSGVIIENVKNKNIYGIIPGKNKNYKPLIIATYYGGIYKTINLSSNSFKPYTIPTALTLDCIRALNFQRLNKPDRTIIFVFLSNQGMNKSGLNMLLDKNFTGNTIILDGIGTDNKAVLTYNKQTKNFAMTVENFLNKSKFKVASKQIDVYNSNNYVYLQYDNLYASSNNNFDTMYKSSKFLLSVLEYECYNLDFLSGNIRGFRSLKRFIRSNSATLSIISITALIAYVFYHSKGEGQ